MLFEFFKHYILSYENHNKCYFIRRLAFEPQIMNIKKISIFFLFLLLSSFSEKINDFQVTCVSTQEEGYVTLKIWDPKKGENYNPKQARIDAIHAILFSGISSGGGCSIQPPILKNAEEQEKFNSIEKSFFAKKGKWSMFTRSSATETSLPTSLGVKNWKVYQVSISKNELRKYLEEQKIIKSLTNGF